MGRTARREQAGNGSGKVAQIQDFDTGVTPFTGSLLPPHSQTQQLTVTVPVLASLEVGLALTHVAGCSCLFHPGTFLSASARRQ